MTCLSDGFGEKYEDGKDSSAFEFLGANLRYNMAMKGTITE